jgi:hypothetical protein
LGFSFELVKQAPDLGQFIAGGRTGREGLHDEFAGRTIEGVVEQVLDEIPASLLGGYCRFIYVGALAFVAADQTLLSHNLQEFQDSRVSARRIITEPFVDLLYGSRTVGPEDTKDIEFGVGGSEIVGRHGCLQR